MEKKFDFIERLIAFAGDVILFVESIPEEKAGSYLLSQIMRSSGSAAFNYVESQGSERDYLTKAKVALKELRETQVNFKILNHVNYGNPEKRLTLENENVELIKILVTIIKNRQAKA